MQDRTGRKQGRKTLSQLRGLTEVGTGGELLVELRHLGAEQRESWVST